ncbi:MAG: hypothetical protein GF315_02970 [candidate division Zixibacteria bacterium]|nr:hypothetical protein [candidate division Zixibacteria bacterium]
MKLRLKILYITCLFIIIITHSALSFPELGSFSEDIPLNESNYRGIYRAVEVLRNQGWLDYFEFYDSPYRFEKLANELESLEPYRLSPSGKAAYEYLRMRIKDHLYSEELTFGADIGTGVIDEDEAEFQWDLYPLLEYKTGGFSFISRYTIASSLEDNPRYQGKKWSGFGGYGSTVYGAYTTERLHLKLGRQRMKWGSGNSGSLILSGRSMPYDGLQFTYALRYNLKIKTFTFVLDPYEDSLGTYNERYLSGHRLIWMPFENLIFGLSEVVIYGGEGRNPEIYYTIPLFFLHGSQLNQSRDDNTLIGTDFRWRPFAATEVYGEFMIDDLQIEDKSKMDDEPAEYAMLFGIYRSGLPLLPLFDLSLEYVRITNRTYNQPEPRNRYINRGYYIGHPLGNDVDKLTGEIVFRPAGSIWVSVELSTTRRGEGRVENQWDTPWLYTDNFKEDFPTGVVEKANEVRIFLEYLTFYNTRLFVSGWYQDINNLNNIEEAEDQTSGFEVGMNFTF